MAPKPKPKPGTTGSRKITVTASSRKVVNKTLKPGSMATQSKIVDVKPKAKPSTKYSPSPMSDAAKRKASRAGETKARQYVDLMGRPPKTGPASTSYSPQKMTAFDKAKAAARGKATAKKTAPKSLVSKVVGRAKTVAREVRDIPTAVGTVIRATADGKKGYNKEYAAAQLKKQLKEVKTAAKSGAKGKSAVQYGGPRGNR
jgi:hypothetical protein